MKSHQIVSENVTPWYLHDILLKQSRDVCEVCATKVNRNDDRLRVDTAVLTPHSVESNKNTDARPSAASSPFHIRSYPQSCRPAYRRAPTRPYCITAWRQTANFISIIFVHSPISKRLDHRCKCKCERICDVSLDFSVTHVSHDSIRAICFTCLIDKSYVYFSFRFSTNNRVVYDPCNMAKQFEISDLYWTEESVRAAG